MLAMRLQRTGRSGHAQFRMIVQDSRFSPTRGRIVAFLGSYDPHTKTATIDSQLAAQYLEKGAQPSDTVARLLKKEGVKLPAWVKLNDPKKGAIRNPAKRRSTHPAEAEAPAPADETPETLSEESPAEEATTPEQATEEKPSEEAAAEEKPAEDTPAES
jgi:small subunit ribosomal protein S16